MKDPNYIQVELSSISKTVAELPQNTPFVVPEGYFTDFSSIILDRIYSENIDNQELSPLLLSLRKENPFVVPDNYIVNFKAPIPVEQARIVPMFSLNKVLKYAVAAAIVGIITTFAVLQNKTEDAGGMAKSENESIISADAFALYLSESEIVEDAESQQAEIEESGSLLVNLDSKAISEILTEISENEISTYLDLIKYEDPNRMN
ncbi:MAG: hypothetical protein RLZZ595_523 [Bacteroidota bacterium]